MLGDHLTRLVYRPLVLFPSQTKSQGCRRHLNVTNGGSSTCTFGAEEASIGLYLIFCVQTHVILNWKLYHHFWRVISLKLEFGNAKSSQDCDSMYGVHLISIPCFLNRVFVHATIQSTVAVNHSAVRRTPCRRFAQVLSCSSSTPTL